jgi:nuclear GTP-binding protein
MVKYSNRGKSKPSKRKTLKTKYKIERKVKQHKKKVRKEMRKLGQKNIKPKSTFLIYSRK